MCLNTAERAAWVGFLQCPRHIPFGERTTMPNRPYNPKQGGLQPYAIRPLPPEREAAVAAMTAIEVAREEARTGEPPRAPHRPA